MGEGGLHGSVTRHTHVAGDADGVEADARAAERVTHGDDGLFDRDVQSGEVVLLQVRVDLLNQLRKGGERGGEGEGWRGIAEGDCGGGIGA